MQSPLGSFPRFFLTHSQDSQVQESNNENGNGIT